MRSGFLTGCPPLPVVGLDIKPGVDDRVDLTPHPTSAIFRPRRLPGHRRYASAKVVALVQRRDQIASALAEHVGGDQAGLMLGSSSTLCGRSRGALKGEEQFPPRAPHARGHRGDRAGSDRVAPSSGQVRSRVRGTELKSASAPWPGLDQRTADRIQFHGVGCPFRGAWPFVRRTRRRRAATVSRPDNRSPSADRDGRRDCNGRTPSRVVSHATRHGFLVPVPRPGTRTARRRNRHARSGPPPSPECYPHVC